MRKRAFDLVVAALGLAVLAPLLVVLAAAVRLTSPGSALFRQERIGRHGRPFQMLKFRSMRAGVGPLVTAAGDPRITRLGHWLRRTKLDELPQLWNVVRGDMSLVGPRPEVARYVAAWPPALRARVLAVRPGITDPAAVRFRHEAELLARAADPEATYLEEILPAKLALYDNYVGQVSFRSDLAVLRATAGALLASLPGDPGHESAFPDGDGTGDGSRAGLS